MWARVGREMLRLALMRLKLLQGGGTPVVTTKLDAVLKVIVN